nr:MAG TPA: hypothetical protein [Caudoviricetes sp.]
MYTSSTAREASSRTWRGWRTARTRSARRTSPACSETTGGTT